MVCNSRIALNHCLAHQRKHLHRSWITQCQTLCCHCTHPLMCRYLSATDKLAFWSILKRIRSQANSCRVESNQLRIRRSNQTKIYQLKEYSHFLDMLFSTFVLWLLSMASKVDCLLGYQSLIGGQNLIQWLSHLLELYFVDYFQLVMMSLEFVGR